MSKANVLLVGLGGVGVIAGYTLERNKRTNLTVVVRSNTNEVKKKGFRIESVDYGIIESYQPKSIVETVEDSVTDAPFDFIVVATKNIPDIVKVENIISSAITPKTTTIVLLQNGIGISDLLFSRFPENAVLSGVSLISSNKYDKTIQHISTDDLAIGYFFNKFLTKEFQKQEAEKFISLYSNEMNHCFFDNDVNQSRWRKLIYNGTMNPVCALTRVDTGRLQIFGAEESILRPAMEEILQIAKSEGAHFKEEVIDLMLKLDDGVWCQPSMLVDVLKGNYIELEVLVGNPVKIAQRNGVSAPYLGLIYNLLKVVQNKTKESKGLISIPKERPNRI